MWTVFNFGLSLLAVAAALPSPSSLNGDIEIVGGQNIDISQAPYQVSVRVNGGHICGGSIISNTHVLSAAHCFLSASESMVTINAGSTNKNMAGQVIQVTRITRHPSYLPSHYHDNDFAVLKLAQPVQFNNKVAKIAMASQGQQVPHGQMVTISGWGWTSTAPPPGPNGMMSNDTVDSDYSFTDVLRAVNLPVVDNQSCTNMLPAPITQNMMCSGGLPSGGQSPCVGDSGGPAVAGGVLVGVVSWGVKGGCAQPNKPSVQARVAAQRNWIDQQLH